MDFDVMKLAKNFGQGPNDILFGWDFDQVIDGLEYLDLMDELERKAAKQAARAAKAK